MQERIKVYAAWVIVGFGGLFAAYLFLRYAAGILLPFLVGWAAALLVRKPAAALHRACKIKEGALRLFLAALAVISFGAVLFWGLRSLLTELSHLVSRFSEQDSGWAQKLAENLSSLPFYDVWGGTGETLFARVGDFLLAELPAVISRLASVLPSFFFGIAVCVVAAVYFCLDLERVHGTLLRLLPQRWRSQLHSAKESAWRAALAVLRADFILMLIAFVGMLIGFSILRLPYPILFSSVFALFDFLPVIGVGAFLVPWGIGLILIGSAWQGVGLLAVFAVITAVRQFAEPHLMGAKAGVHPLLMLLSMYAGARFFGAAGILLAPMVTLLLFGILNAPAENAKK